MIRTCDDQPGVARITLARPEKRNAIDERGYRDFAAAVTRLASRPDVHAVVLAAKGPVFCAGTDLSELATAWPQPPKGPIYRLLEALHCAPVPVIAAVDGPAVGLGATLLLHCDLVFMARSAWLRFPFLELGLTVEGGGSRLLPRLLGRARAMDLLLSGRDVPAAEAAALGLASRLCPDGAALEAATALARVIAARPRDAAVATKRLVRSAEGRDILDCFERELQAINGLLAGRRMDPRPPPRPCA